MCGRFTSLLTPELISIIKGVEASLKLEHRYNVAPTQLVPIVRENSVGGRELIMARWGLIPSWAKDDSIAKHTINARSETVTEKPAFRHAIQKQRCIVPANGFYEWDHSTNPKRPSYITMADKSLMMFAGIWEYWKNPEGQGIESFSILTTESNSTVKRLHDRMPVILKPEDIDLWIDSLRTSAELLIGLFTPFPDALIELYEVSTLVNNPKNDTAECIERV